MMRATVKNSQPKKYGKLLAKLADTITWNKLCVDIRDPYKICRRWREPLILKAVIMIYPITRCFEITQYNDKKETKITNLVKTTCWSDIHVQWKLRMTEGGGGSWSQVKKDLDRTRICH